MAAGSHLAAAPHRGTGAVTASPAWVTLCLAIQALPTLALFGACAFMLMPDENDPRRMR